MKSIKIAAIFAAASLMFVACVGATSNEKQPAGITKADVDSTSYYIGYSFGMQIAQSNMGAMSLAMINKGIKDAVSGEVEISQDAFYETVNGFIEKRMDVLASVNLEKEAEFFARNGKKEGVVTTESGIQYKILSAGNGVKPGSSDTVEVNYEGKFLDGKEFDSSYKRGETTSFSLDQVIPGWSEGLTYIDEGGKIELWIPAELAYGPSGNGIIGPNETLNFVVELIKVTPYVAPEAEEE